MPHWRIKKRKPSGGVPRLIEFTEHAYYVFSQHFMHRMLTRQTSEWISENMYTALFLICQNIFEISFSLFTANVKVVIPSCPPQHFGWVLIRGKKTRYLIIKGLFCKHTLQITFSLTYRLNDKEYYIFADIIHILNKSTVLQRI